MQNYFFNPYEVAFCGFSSSGKTTLICRLIESLSARYCIGVLKSDAHKFAMDKQGKDTYSFTCAGATSVAINSLQSRAILTQKPKDYFWGKGVFLDCDIFFIEGYKRQKGLKKIVVLDEDNAIAKEVEKADILCYVGREKGLKTFNKFAYFHRDEVDEIKGFILNYFAQKTAKIKFKGLVLGGGQSVRMGRDKCNIIYQNNQSISRRLLDLLSCFCEEVYLSCRAEQQLHTDLSEAKKLYDSFDNFGPSAGIMTALEKDKNCAWIVLACDLPFLEKTTVEKLIANYNPYNYATCFQSQYDGLPEPLAGIYSPKVLSKFYCLLATGKKCPRKLLIHSPITLLEQDKPYWLDNANTQEQAEQIKSRLNKK